MATRYVVIGDQALCIENKMAEIQRQVFLQKEYPHDPEALIHHLQRATEGNFIVETSPSRVGMVESPIIVPNLRSTGPMLAEWLKAREELHKFFTGETVILRDIFVLTDEELASTAFMPAFRPAGATNQMAVDWKRCMGVSVFVEEDENKGGVMRYKNSKGLKEPELYLINRSVRPDGDTLRENAKSPDGLIAVSNKLWPGLFGWCDADTLHFAINGGHLRFSNLDMFSLRRLPVGWVAVGCWSEEQVELYLDGTGLCDPLYGASPAKKVPLRP